jgi:hypothetical protein
MAVDIEILTALIAAGGATLIGALSTDAWRALRSRLSSRAEQTLEIDTVVEQLNTATVDAARHVAEEEVTPAAIDAELADVAHTLNNATRRLHAVVERAQRLEDDVQGLLRQADVARAAAQLSESDAEKIGRLIAAQTEDRFRHEISELVARHTNEVRAIKRAGTRAGWMSAVIGLLAGIPIGLLVNWASSALGM